MFIIEKQILKTNVWDVKSNCMVEVETYFYTPCGSDYTILCDDLKTIRGIEKRYSHWINEKSRAYKIERIAIYRTSNWLQDTSKISPIHIIK